MGRGAVMEVAHDEEGQHRGACARRPYPPRPEARAREESDDARAPEDRGLRRLRHQGAWITENLLTNRQVRRPDGMAERGHPGDEMKGASVRVGVPHHPGEGAEGGEKDA